MTTDPPAASPEPLDLAAALRLQAWLSPAYPIGAYSFSGGLETAAAEGLVRGGQDLADWIETSLHHGAGWTDAVFLAAAWRAVAAPALAEETLEDVAALAAAFAPGRERWTETRALGAAFLRVSAEAYSWPDPARQASALAALGPEPAYPAALGAWAAGFATPLRPTLALFLQSLAANVVSAGIRLSLTGQTEGQSMLSALRPRFEATAAAAAAAPLEALGGAMLVGDLAGLAHETQRVRLFRS